MTSPFKFLDAYDPQDKDIFFGRTEEVDALYALIFQTDLLLVYGQSGTGKTSLIQCGLASRFRSTDRFELLVRRKDDLNLSLDREVRRHALTPIDEGASLADAVQSLYLDHLRPVHIIFDQFEELFLLGSAEEQRTFITAIAALLEKEVACKIVIVMREEFIAMLYEFEQTVPTLFRKRFRVEPMNLQNVTRVITGTTAAFGIELEQGEGTARQIIENLSDHRAGVQLSYLQVYLDKLYRDAAKARGGQSGSDAPIVFSERLVREAGALDDVLADFLEEQTVAIQGELKARDPKVRADAVQVVLEEFATLEGTKQPMSRVELAGRLPELGSIIDACLAALARSRVVRQVEEVYELAHDALARRIADNRSAERKTLLKVQKIVRDRYSSYEQTKTLLSGEELNFAKPYLTRLGLSAGEAAFVRKSGAKHRARQRFLVAGSLAVAIVSVVVVVVVGQARAKAEKTITDAGAVVGFLSRIQAALEPITGTGDVRRELIESANGLKQRLGLTATEPSTDFWQRMQRGDTALNYDDIDGARTQYQAARVIAATLGSATTANPVWQRNLMLSYQSLGDAEKKAGKTQPEAEWRRKALDLAGRLAQADPANPQARGDQSVAYAEMGDVTARTGTLEDARGLYDKALAITEQLARADSDNPDRQRALLSLHRRLGDHYVTRSTELEKNGAGDAARAEEARRAALDQYRQALSIADDLSIDSRDRETPVVQSELYTALGDLELAGGHRPEARDWYTKALAHDEETTTDPRRRLSISYNRLGDLEKAEHKHTAARDWYHKGRAIAEHLRSTFPDIATLQQDLFVSYFNLGALEQADGHASAARDWFSRALPIADALAKADPNDGERAQNLADVRAALAGLAR